MPTGLLRKTNEPGYFRLMSQDGEEVFFYRKDLRSIRIDETTVVILHSKEKAIRYRAGCIFVFTEELITGAPIEPCPVRKEFRLYEHEDIEMVTAVVKEVADGVWGKA